MVLLLDALGGWVNGGCAEQQVDAACALKITHKKGRIR
jgi:hypothetical protein